MRRVVGWLPVLGLLCLALPAGAALPAPDSPVCVPRTTSGPADLALESDLPVPGHPLVRRLTFHSAAMQGEAHAEVQLPAGYDPASTQRYPVLYLLHGHGGRESDWVNHGADQILAAQPWIVVYPDGGYDGWYSDWYGSDVDGHSPTPLPAWESFHIRELLPWVDAHYATLGTRSGRAIAGLSMGGFGAMSYAARHPDLFATAASFSGAVDSDQYYPVAPVVTGLVANAPDGNRPDNCIWGDPATQDVRWRDHDPTELVGNLRTVRLAVMSGNGQPGPHDNPMSPSPGGIATESGIGLQNQSFDQALTAAGVAHSTWFYGNGTHSWPYWLDDLRQWLPELTAGFGQALPTSTFDYATAASDFQVFGWSFTTHRDVTEFSYLTGVSSAGLTARGSGPLDVVTAGDFHPRRTYALAGATVALARADAHGRLAFTVDLGPSHSTQQYAFGAPDSATWTTKQVVISSQ